MELPLFALEELQAFLLCLLRVGSLMMAIPILAGRQVPAQVRLGLAVVLALLVFPLVDHLIPRHLFSPGGLALLVVQEIILGSMVAFIGRFVFNAVEMGGTVVGYKMGFAAANIFDPQTQSQSSVVAKFQSTLAMMIFLALDGHFLFLQIIARSYELLPLGQLNLGGEAVPFLMRLVGNMFSMAVQLSAPVLAVLILSGFVMGILARVFPQLNVLFLSFPVNIGLAFLVTGLTLSMVATLLSREFDAAGERILQLFRLLS